MIIIPAIDLKNGKCVRLKQGKMDKSTTYSDDPAEVAENFEKTGVKRLHIVDLNGAFSGKPENMSSIKKIIEKCNMITELGGGIRDIPTIEKYFNIGINYIILGTVIVENKELVKAACKNFPEKIIAGIDAVNGKVAVKGWKEVTDIDAFELAKEMESLGIREIIYTDISRDGMQTGVNVDAVVKLQKKLNIPVIASGGVSNLDDIKILMEHNVYGVITGRAVYEGTLNLDKALEIVKC
jgi:phosphoribosylformimino-5-aminoimidazole carboxamide ribotide isomerase